MCLRVCLYVCVWVYVSACVFMCLRVRLCVCVCVYVSACVYVYISVSVYRNTHIYIHVSACMCLCVCVCVYVYIRVSVYRNTHLYIVRSRPTLRYPNTSCALCYFRWSSRGHIGSGYACAARSAQISEQCRVQSAGSADSANLNDGNISVVMLLCYS